jgi:hypothetical protein
LVDDNDTLDYILLPEAGMNATKIGLQMRKPRGSSPWSDLQNSSLRALSRALHHTL